MTQPTDPKSCLLLLPIVTLDLSPSLLAQGTGLGQCETHEFDQSCTGNGDAILGLLEGFSVLNTGIQILAWVQVYKQKTLGIFPGRGCWRAILRIFQTLDCGTS